MFKNKDGKVRSGWKIAAIMGSTFGIITLISFLMGIILSGILFISGNLSYGPDSIVNYTELGKLVMSKIALVGMFLQEIIMIVTPIIAWRFVMKRKLPEMGLTSLRANYRELISGLIFGAASISIVFAAIVLTGNASVVSWKPNFHINQLIYLVLFILVGLAEEILGRGFIMSVLRQTRSIPAILIISSVIFALMHSSNPGIGIVPYINLALVGALFAYMYIKSNNLWMCIGYHITWNYFQGFVYGFKVSGMNSTGILTTTYQSNNILNGGAFGPEGGLFVTAVILLGFLVVKYYYRNAKKDFFAMDPPVIQHTAANSPFEANQS
jgi:membrane protease YdiL (CAAX protease family)